MSYLAGVRLDNPFMNASGCWCTTEKELDELMSSSSGAVVTKSCTISAREGNVKPRLWHTDTPVDISINSIGLENLGYRFYIDYQFRSKKPFIISLHPFSPEELDIMLYDLDATLQSRRCISPTLFEINISCPNIPNRALKETFNIDHFLPLFGKYNSLKCGLKMPPLFNKNELEDISLKILNNNVKFITCCNSLPNGLLIDDKNETRIAPNSGLGGIGGFPLKPISLSNVYQFHKLIGHKVDIIGCGGISNLNDIYEYKACGATAFQIGTSLLNKGPGIFADLIK